MGNVLSYLKINGCSTDFLLEIKHPNYPFPIYRPDDLRIDVCRVNVPREEVLSIQQVQVPVGVNVCGLKEHLRLLMPDLLPPPSTDLVLVMYHHSSQRFPIWFHLSDDQLPINKIIDLCAYYKLFVAVLTPDLAADLESGFKDSDFYRFLRKVENVVILHIALPEVNEDILERLMIPMSNKQKPVENNNKQDIISGENCMASVNATAEEENMATCAVTTSDQSTSEDSSLTDSERTIIGEPPQLEGHLSSPSDSEQLSSPETNMTMEMNGDVDDECSDDMDNRLRSNREFYIKVTPYIQNNQKMVKIVVHRSAEWSLVEKYLEPCCGGVPRHYLLVTTGSGDVARPADTVRDLFLRKHYDYLSVRLHRPLAHNENKKKVYRFLPNSPQPFQYLCDWIVVRGQTVGDSKRALLKCLEKRNAVHTPYNRCRLRKKNWKAVGRPWLDTDTWEETRNPEELLLEELEADNTITGPHLIPIFIRRVYPFDLSFSQFLEIVIDTTQPFNLIQQISDLSCIPVEHLKVARSSNNFPCETSVYVVIKDLDWYQDMSVLSSPKFCLDYSDEYAPIILYRDAREEEKKLEEIQWTEDCSYRTSSTKEFMYEQYNNSVLDRERRERRLAMQSPRKEKPLKIYLQSKDSGSPPPGSDGTTTDSCSENFSCTKSCMKMTVHTEDCTTGLSREYESSNSDILHHVPPPDYD